MFDNISPKDMDAAQLKAWNNRIVGQIVDGSPENVKLAEMSMQEYIRPFNREMEFANQILTPKPHTDEEVVPSTEHDMPMIMIEIEPASPGAMVVDFGYAPPTFYPYGQRITVAYQMQMTERVVKNVIELRSYAYRFRQAVTDLSSLQLAAQRDARFMRAVRRLLGVVNTALPYSGQPNNVDYGSNMTHDIWNRFLDIPTEHPNKLTTATVLTNTLNMKWLKSMIVNTFQGTELAASVWNKAFETVVTGDNGVRIVATIKDALVGRNEYLGFAAENRLGRYSVLQEPTMVVKNEGQLISFYQWEALLMALVNPTGVSRGVCNNS